MSEVLDRLLRRDIGAKGQSHSMLPQYLLFVSLATALPLVILLSVQVWMATVYTGSMDLNNFNAQYYRGVYRYRILGRDLLVDVYYFLRAHVAERPYPLPRDPSGSFLFYSSYVLSNGFYFSISNVLLLSFLWMKKRGLLDRELSLYFYYTLLLALSMAVVTPYDQLAYLLLLIGIWGTRVKSPGIGMILVALSAVAGTLNRETAFLLASFLATLALFSPRQLAKRYGIYLAIDLVLSVAVYAGIRMMTPGKLQLIQATTYGGKWALESLPVASLLLASGVAMGMRLHNNVRPALVLLALSLPYGFAIWIGGEFRELRLIIPVLLSVICLYVILNRTPGDSQPVSIN